MKYYYKSIHVENWTFYDLDLKRHRREKKH